MGIATESVNWNDIATAEQFCRTVGVEPPPFREWIDQIDFDPQPTLDALDRLRDGRGALDEQVSALDAAVPASGTWTGAGADLMAAHADCQRGFWGHVGDFLLWLVENLVQLLDYVVDFLRIIVAWITWLATALCVLAAAVIMVVGTIMGLGIGGIVSALINAPILAIAGAIATVGILVSLLLVALNALFEWLEQIIRDARGSICGKGLPSLPDWDPEGWEPPLWPI